MHSCLTHIHLQQNLTTHRQAHTLEIVLWTTSEANRSYIALQQKPFLVRNHRITNVHNADDYEFIQGRTFALHAAPWAFCMPFVADCTGASVRFIMKMKWKNYDFLLWMNYYKIASLSHLLPTITYTCTLTIYTTMRFDHFVVVFLDKLSSGRTDYIYYYKLQALKHN